jgi:hypothetical protein
MEGLLFGYAGVVVKVEALKLEHTLLNAGFIDTERSTADS